MLGSVFNLEKAIASSIVIPPELRSHFIFSTTGLGGVFLEYYSNNSGGVNSLNSRVMFQVSFDTTDGAGRYIGDSVGMEIHRYRNIKPFRSVKTKLPYQQVVAKLNKWLVANKTFLMQAMEN